jgi:hypothetical protein
MKLDCTRKWLSDKAIISVGYDGQHSFYMLENRELAIPVGIYPIEITMSNRFTLKASKPGCSQWIIDHKHDDGSVWLPELIGVPKRTGIRIHPANIPEQLHGCLAPGILRGNGFINRSGEAFAALCDKIQFALHSGEQVTIDIRGDQNVTINAKP